MLNVLLQVLSKKENYISLISEKNEDSSRNPNKIVGNREEFRAKIAAVKDLTAQKHRRTTVVFSKEERGKVSQRKKKHWRNRKDT